MQIREISEKSSWENFVQSFSPNNFLTSWSWGDFHQAMGDKVFRLGLFDKDSLIGVCLAVKVAARRGSFIVCPAGPLVKDFDKNNFRFFVEELEKLSKREAVSFLRVRPLIHRGKVEESLKSLRFNYSPTHVHAQISWILDISPDEESLLAGMRKTTRYLVKDGERRGLKVKVMNSQEGLNILDKLQQETVGRHRFVPFPKKYLENEFATFSKNDEIKIFVAEFEKEPLAAAMVVFYGDTAFYHHGASLKTKLPASYAIQWEAIKTAKRLGKKYYNFWGIAPNDNPSHPWAGLTLFKIGFGGFRVEYAWPQDLPLSPFYPLIYWLEKLRAIYRRLA